VWKDSKILAQMLEQIESDPDAREIRERLQLLGLNLDTALKFALLSCSPEGKLTNKKARGKIVLDVLKKMIVGYEFRCYPADHPDFLRLQAANEQLLEFAKAALKRATKPDPDLELPRPFDTQRFGTIWNSNYLFHLRGYIARISGWSPEQVLTATTRLVSAARAAIGEPQCYESPLRDLIREALHNFEANPENKRTVAAQSKLLDRLSARSVSHT
jgi:hypothetical protein